MSQFHPEHVSAGRKQVSLTNEHTVPKRWISIVTGRSAYFTAFLLLYSLMNYLLQTCVLEVFFPEASAFHVVCETLALAAFTAMLFLVVYEPVAHVLMDTFGYIPREVMVTSPWPWELKDSSKVNSYGPLNSPAERAKDWVRVHTQGDLITAEHLCAGCCMVLGGFLGGSAAWFRHGVCLHVGSNTAEFIQDYYNHVKKSWTEGDLRKYLVRFQVTEPKLEKTWTEFFQKLGGFLLDITLWFACEKGKGCKLRCWVIHHGPSWLLLIPLCIYFAGNPLFQLSCGVLAFNPEHYLGHCLWPIRYAMLESHNGRWKCNTKLRGAWEIEILFGISKGIFIFGWRVFLFQLPLAYHIGQQLWLGEFTLLTLGLVVGYSFMSWFNYSMLFRDWVWRSQCNRMAQLRGAKVPEPHNGGLQTLHLNNLKIRPHLEGGIHQELKHARAAAKHSGMEVLDHLSRANDTQLLRKPSLQRCQSLCVMPARCGCRSARRYGMQMPVRVVVG